MYSLPDLVSRNYKTLKQVATNITKSRSFADDLINETYIIINNRGHILPEDDLGFVKVYSKFMKYQAIPETGKYRTSDFQRLIRPKEVACFDMTLFEEIESELSDKVTKEIMLAEIIRFKQSLNALELVLFELHYEKGLTLTKIVEMYSDRDNEMSFNCLWKLYTPLKLKIKKFKWRL